MGPGRPSVCSGPSCSAEGEEGTSVRQWDVDLQARPRSPATHMPLAGTQSHGPTCLKGGWEIRVLEETMGLACLPDLPHLGACLCPQMLRDSRFSWVPPSGLTPSSSEVGPRAPFPAGSSPAQLPHMFCCPGPWSSALSLHFSIFLPGLRSPTVPSASPSSPFRPAP